METSVNEIVSKFRELSSRVYREIWLDFRERARHLDRQRDENVFQQLQARYGKELEKQLDREKIRCLEMNQRHREQGFLQRELSHQVTLLVSGYYERVRAL